jgi:tetrahydromethanopterin S-methyltransferase subunit E
MSSIRSRASSRFWAETIGGSVTGLLLLLTLVWREWIEILFRVDPDNGSGALEVGIVIACAGATLVLGMLARREWRRSPLPA